MEVIYPLLVRLKYKINDFLRRFFFLRILVIKYRAKKGTSKPLSKDQIIKKEIKNYERFYGKKPNLKNPSLFSEKIFWQKLFYFDENLTRLADKLLVKQFAKETLGMDLFPKTIKVFKTYNDIEFSNLPEVFVIKPNHVSGYIYKGQKKGDKYVFTDIKNRFAPSYSERRMKKIFKNVLKINLYKETYEWVYENVEPHIFVEEYIDMKNMKEYKFQMADGKVGVINQLWGRTDKTYDNYYDSDLNFMDIRWDNPSNEAVKLPNEIKTIMTYAQKLSKGIPLARVDFYLIDGAILLGEITFFYSAGYLNFIEPKNLDAIIGAKLDISKYL